MNPRHLIISIALVGIGCVAVGLALDLRNQMGVNIASSASQFVYELDPAKFTFLYNRNAKLLTIRNAKEQAISLDITQLISGTTDYEKFFFGWTKLADAPDFARYQPPSDCNRIKLTIDLPFTQTDFTSNFSGFSCVKTQDIQLQQIIANE